MHQEYAKKTPLAGSNDYNEEQYVISVTIRKLSLRESWNHYFQKLDKKMDSSKI